MVRSLYTKALKEEKGMYNVMHEIEISNIINYLRRSRQDLQREKLTGEDTLSAQRKLMTSVLDKFEIPYVQKNEIGSGDRIDTRPVFKDVLKELKEGKFDAIAVKEISRLTRGNFTDAGIIYDLIMDKRIYIITPYKIYDPSNLADLKQIRFELFMSREEYETIKERLNGARYNSALEGKWMGKVPFGFERNKRTMRLDPKEEEAKIIELIYDLYVNGFEGKKVRERAIGTILKRLEIKTPKNCINWDTNTIKRILTNEAYIGIAKFRTTKRTSQGKVVKRPESEHIIAEDAHKPIIKRETFDHVQQIMNNHQPRTKLDADTYELTGLITCRHCGRKSVINRYKRKRANEDYYDMYLKCRNGCYTVKYNFVEEKILELLKHLKEADQTIITTLYKKSIEKHDQIERESLKEQILIQAKQKKEDLKKKLRFVADKHFEGIYTDEDYLDKKRQIDRELKEVEALLQGNLEIAATSEDIDIEKINSNFVKISDAYNKSNDAAAKNELLRNLFESVFIDILEKGTKKEAPKIKFDVTLSYNFWN